VFYHLDHQGSVRALTDEDGEVVATYSYDPYGNPAGTTGSIDQPLRYTGQYLDTETGLYQLRARYYDPTTGQFTTIDPLLADTNEPYTYATNDPINNIDPLGLCAWSRPWDCPGKAWNAAWGAGRRTLADVYQDARDDLTDWSPRGVTGKVFGYSAGILGGIACAGLTGGNPGCVAAFYISKRAGKATGRWVWDQFGRPNRWPRLELPGVVPMSGLRSILGVC
jgi:RHS repeat-associated protein